MTITTCCALHNFCLDNNDNAADISEETIREFEAEVQSFSDHVDEGNDDDEDDDDIEVTVSNLPEQEDEGTADVGETLQEQHGRSLPEIQDAHSLSQQIGREVRDRMAANLAPLAGTQARQLRRSVLNERRQQALARLAANRSREHLRRQMHASRRNARQ